MKSKLYTGGGDHGTTSLIGGTRVRKTDLRLEAYGTVDELNSFIGVLITQLPSKEELQTLLKIQHKLFAIGGYLATDQEQTTLKRACRIAPSHVEALEQQIDTLDSLLPPMKAFVLPGGSPAASAAHVCRTVCRRAERHILQLTEQNEPDLLLMQYMNRLSDYFFVLARKLSLEEVGDEIIWDKSFDD